MNKQEALIEKIEAQAGSERALGNHDAADAAYAKAERLRHKYNLPRAEPIPSAPQDKREAFTKWLESLPPEAEVVVDDPLGGMQRTMPLEVVLSRLKSGDLLLIGMGRGWERFAWKGSTKEYAFFRQEVAEQPTTKDGSKWIYV
jgi:hypothetical protein